MFRGCRADKGGTISLSGAGMESELANDKRAFAGIVQREVHPTLGIIKNTEACDLLCEPFDICRVVFFFNA